MLSRVEHEIIHLLPGYHIISYDILLCQLSTKDLFTHRDSERGWEFVYGKWCIQGWILDILRRVLQDIPIER